MTALGKTSFPRRRDIIFPFDTINSNQIKNYLGSNSKIEKYCSNQIHYFDWNFCFLLSDDASAETLSNVVTKSDFNFVKLLALTNLVLDLANQVTSLAKPSLG